MSVLIKTYPLPHQRSLELAQGDLTTEPVDAIVNAANEHLMHGGGIAAAIARAGGATINRESEAWVREHGPVSHAQPAYTAAGKMPAKYVIHAVGPVWGSGGEDRKLAAAYSGSLALADQLGLRSIAFPSISTGIFSFPRDRAARIVFEAIPAYFEQHPESGIKVVRLVIWDDDGVRIYLGAGPKDS